MAGSITAANCQFYLGVVGVYPIPQLLQNFAADDVFDFEDIETGEVRMGVDGHMAAGFVFNPVKQKINFMADSPSIGLFEAWYAAERAAADKYFAFGTVYLPSLSKAYVLRGGALITYSPSSSAKKVLETRQFSLAWESISGAPA